MTEQVTVRPCAGVRGRVRVPGDKSISHRAAMLSGLAQGTSVLTGYLRCEDCLNTLRAVEALGAGVQDDGAAIRVTGCAGAFSAPGRVLDMGNSGTGIRLICGILAAQPFTVELTGDASLCRRPMGRIRKPLEAMGARMEATGPRECPPIRITGGRLKAIDYAMPVASAQVKATVLLAGLFADGTTSVTEPQPTRDHTERMLRRLGLPMTVEGRRVSVRGAAGGRPAIRAMDWRVPGDFSSAAFWLAAGCMPGSEVVVEGVGLNPRRTAFLDVLKRMGARIDVEAEADAAAGDLNAWEPAGAVRVRGGALRATEVGGDEIPNLIDELPLVAVLGALAEGTTVIRDAEELRVKESDRIAAMAAGLRRMGVDVTETPDGMAVRGGGAIRGNVAVESLGDHRIAMALSILALLADGPVEVRDIACVATSYPEFWEHLGALTGGRAVTPPRKG
jgi:3-phosphoshikimate 1-carboxyvinyltransferase